MLINQIISLIGCKEETERVEKLIKAAGGTIGTCTGITDAQCNQAKKLILNEDPPASFVISFLLFSIVSIMLITCK